MRKVVYEPTRPQLVVEHTGSKALGRCYSSTSHKITSTIKLSDASLNGLFSADFLGIGQTFYIRKRLEPAGEDTANPVEYVDNKRTENVPFDEYNKKPYEPIKLPYYVYECETFCDSGD